MKYIKIVIIAVLSLMAAVSVYKGCENAALTSQDFQWDAAKALSLKINPYDESINPTGALNTGELGVFYERFESIGAPQKMEANQFPSLLILLIPYTLFSPEAARFAWIISNLIFTGLIIWLLRQTFLENMDRFVYICLSLLMLAGTPYRNQLGVGQHTLFAFAFFMLAVFCDKKGWFIGTTISLFISYFKYTLTAPLVLYFVYKKKYKEIVVSILGHVILTIVSAFWLGDSVINMITKPLKVASVLSSEGGLDLGALLGGSSLAFALAGIIAIVLFVFTLKAPLGCENVVFAASLLWSLILTYHRTYDFFVLICVACLFETSQNLAVIEDKYKSIYLGGFLISLFSVFFVLRLFSENAVSKIAVGTVYYIFTLAVTLLLVMPRKFLKIKFE